MTEEQEISEQEHVRRVKLNELRSCGYSYPNIHGVKTFASDARALAENGDTETTVVIGGRIMTVRIMGKAAFFNIQDGSGTVQVYLKKEEVGDEAFDAFKDLDIGDIVEVSAKPFITKTGEPSVHASSCRLLVKCLHPLPEKWHGLTDTETRYRQRYLDLIINAKSREVFVKRARIVSAIRSFLDSRGYVEVETPVLVVEASGAEAKPFKTYHNALGLDLQLRIATELPLKKLVVGGLERVYEIGRIFRNEGISTKHNPEFTSIEFYQAYATYDDLMDLTEELLEQLCTIVNGTSSATFREHQISFQRPYARMTMIESCYQFGGVDRKIDLSNIKGIHEAARQLNIPSALAAEDYGLALYELFDKGVEHLIINPTFITQHPLTISPLSRKSDTDPRFVDRFELIVAGMEIANAFSELNDPEDQAQRFQQQLLAKAAGNDEATAGDEDFITALEYGMPPTAGEGIGIDRLTMLLTNCDSIRDVILFPTQRPKKD
jgi:lysyl-tRNA synthetase class 2